jgi:hypothetical protein
MFRQWVAALAAEQCSVIRKLSIWEEDTKRPKFWLAVEKLNGLEKLIVKNFEVGDREVSVEETEEDSVFREKLDTTVGHEVDLKKGCWMLEERD